MSNLKTNQVDGLITHDINLKGRKVVNAADGTDTQDYVTLKQLNTISSQTTQSIPNSLYFYLSILGNLTVHNDAAPRIWIPRSGIITEIRCDIKTAPTGANVIISLDEGTNPPLNITIPAGSSFIKVNLASPISVLADTYFVVNITQIGSTLSGADLTIAIVIQ